MKYKHLTKSHRLEISILLSKGYAFREIGRVLGHNPSSISREVNNNGGRDNYDHFSAQHQAYRKRKYSKYQGMKVRNDPALERYITEKMRSFWTPDEIAGRLKRKNNDQTIISPKSIYKYLYSPYGQSLCCFLPSKQCEQRKGHKHKRGKKIMIPNRISIENRPETVLTRIMFGNFEGDTLGRARNNSPETLAGLLERKSRYFLGVKVHRLKYAVDGFKRLLNPHHRIVNTLTLDNGVENSRWQELDINTYFCHAFASWEKGSIENTFARLRRFIPKKADLRNYTDKQISDIISLMNNTPRKCLGYRTPTEVFNEQNDLIIKQGGVALQGTT